MKKFHTDFKSNITGEQWFYYDSHYYESYTLKYYEYFNSSNNPLKLFQSYSLNEKIVILFFNLLK